VFKNVLSLINPPLSLSDDNNPFYVKEGLPDIFLLYF